jgi:tRNA pseudouridine38-40 synthase
LTLFDPEAGAGSPAPGSGPAAGRSPLERLPQPLAPGAVRIRMTVAYDGTDFRGFAVQPGIPTVAGALTQALDTAVGHPVELVCAGRTDAGVHAAGQVVHFDVSPERCRASFAALLEDQAAPPLPALRRALNRMLAPRIVVRAAEPAPPRFDARRSARWRRYRYTVLNRPDPDPFLARTTWHVDEPLDLRAMQLSCDAIYGEHDFAAFCRQRPDRAGSTVRRVLQAEWCDGSAPASGRPSSGRVPEPPSPELLVFEIRASAFCHQMVRSLVGTMVDMGRGRLKAGEMSAILRSGSRSAAGVLAPPRGLCLVDVGY